MADDEWDKKEFTLKPFVKSKDKWDGEDEEEAVKDNWDDEEEEEKPAAAPTTTQSNKPKNKLKEKLAEKEKLEELQRLERARALMTPQELAAEKLRQLKLQEESELQMVKQAFGGSGEIDTADPMTKDDFDELRRKIVQDLRRFEKRAPFEDFVEDMVQDLCLSLPSKRLKKVKTSVEALYFEKSKTEKAAISKTTSKTKPQRAKLYTGGDKDMLSAYGGAEDVDNEFDDFM